MNTSPVTKMKHLGRNVKRIREIVGMKQETLAAELNINQQKMSFIEAKEEIDLELLEKIAKVLHVPVDAIQNFDEDAAINIFANSITNNDHSAVLNYQPTFNPIDKVIDLYERMLKEKDEQIAKLLARN
jgi:transcriptional regulator with XRE-family HTH domain